MKFSLEVNGNPAQKALADLDKATRDLVAENKNLTASRKMLEAQGKKDSDEYRALTKAIKDNSATIKSNRTEIDKLQKEIGLTGLSMAQLTNKATALKATLRNLIPGTADHQRYQTDLSAVSARINELSGRGQQAGMSIGSIADGFNRYAALGASAIGILTGVVVSAQGILDFNGKLSDAQTNVQKTTGMTKAEVDELTKSFGLLKTRTARIDLLGIAEIGGRLGIAKEEIQGFVTVMNKAAVALGDSFEGGPEVVAEKLGKIKGLYEELKNTNIEIAFDSVGSALNDLGASGAASEQNVADFVTRVGAMPKAFQPSIATALGLGAAFEESGLMSEKAASNYAKVIGLAANNTAGFARVMGKSKKEIDDLINTNPNEFFLKFADSIKNLKGTSLANVLDSLKLNDNEVKMVLGAAGKNVELFRDKIKLANDSMIDATSLTTEYDLKNNNLAATLDKLKKRVTEIFTSDTFVKGITGAVNWLSKFLGVTDDVDGKVTKFRGSLIFLLKIISVGLTAMFSYAASLQMIALWTGRSATATALSNLVFKIQYYWLVTTDVATKALALTQSLLTFKISEVRKAYVALMASMSLSPWGALVAVIVAAGVAYAAFSESNNDSQKIMEANLQILNSVSEQTAKQKTTVTELVAIMKDENATIDQKNAALKELKKISDGYLEGLNLENIATKEGTRLIDRYILSIDDLARAKAIVEIKTKLNTQKFESENKVLALSLEKKSNKNEGNSYGGSDGKFFGLGGRNKREIDTEINEQKSNTDNIDLQIKALDITKSKQIGLLQTNIKKQNNRLKSLKTDSKQYKELAQDIKNDNDELNILIGLPSKAKGSGQDSDNSDVILPDDKKAKAAPKNPNSTDAELNKLRADELAKHNAELLKLQRQYEDDRISAMEDGYKKELLIENTRYSREISDLKAKKVNNSEVVELDSKIAKARESGDMKLVGALTIIKNGWAKRNDEINNKITSIEEQKFKLHANKLGTIQERAGKNKLEEDHRIFELQKTERETAFNNELATLNLLDAQKKIRTDAFNNTELELQKKYLEDKIRQIKQILFDQKIDGIDFNLLSPDAMQKLKEDIAFLQNALSKIEGKKTNEQGGTDFTMLQGAGTDILGFSPQQWDATFANLDTAGQKLAATEMILGGLQNAWGAYSAFVDAQHQKQLRALDRKSTAEKTKLKTQFDNGYLNKVQYERAVKKVDEDKEKQQAELEYKKAKRDRITSLMTIAFNTALGVAKAVAASPLTLGMPWSAIIAGMGALQAATVLATPLPAKGFEEGLYPDFVKREQDGKIFKARNGGMTKSGMVTSPTYFLAGEGNKPEMIIDNKAWRQLSPDLKDSLVRQLRGVKGFENGYYQNEVLFSNSKSNASPTQSASNAINSNDDLMKMMMSVIALNTAVMQDLRDNPIESFVSNKNLKSMKNLKDGMKDYESLKSKNTI